VGHQARHSAVAVEERVYPEQAVMGGGGKDGLRLADVPLASFAAAMSRLGTQE
jgi:hypothetical protein